MVYLLWPDRLAHFSSEVKRQKNNMLSYIVLLRATPVLPNTFINVASPMVDVPLTPFMLGKLASLHYACVCQLSSVLCTCWQLVSRSRTNAPILHAGTLLGCLPNNFVAVSAGSRLAELTSLKDLYDRRLILLGVPCLAWVSPCAEQYKFLHVSDAQ